MELIVISNPRPVKGEVLIINQLFEAGLKRFHLRKPDYDRTQYINLLKQINKDHHQAIAIHHHHEIAGDFEINRLHYPETMRIEAGLEKLASYKKGGFILSTSVHELNLLNSLNLFEYAFFGPVFNSISKPDYQSVVSPDFRLDKRNIPTKVIALGGVRESDMNSIGEMNFDGAAIMGFLWSNPDDAIFNFRNLLKAEK